MALVPPFYLDCVVAIGTMINGEKHWIGTGFLYGSMIEKTKDGLNRYKPFLIPNKHVFEGIDSIIVRFNPQTNQPAKDYVEALKDKDGKLIWTGHPTKEVDVAVIPVDLNKIRNEGMKCNFFQSDDHTLTIQELIDIEASEGDFVYTMGFPMGIVAKDRQHVFIRSGIIARIRDLFEKRSNDFVIDSFVFPGNSGGPVISKPEHLSITGTKSYDKSDLIGMVKSYIPDTDVAISMQTKKPRITFEENTGLTKVEPVDHIIETIEIFEKNQT